MNRSLAQLASRMAVSTGIVAVLALASGCSGGSIGEAASPSVPAATPAPTATAAGEKIAAAPRTNYSGVLGFNPLGGHKPAPINAKPEVVSTKPAAVAAKTSLQGNTKEDEANRKKILGRWFQHKGEKRTITLKEDGTALIQAELDDYRQYLVGKNIEFDIEWTLKDEVLTFVTTGGRPAESIKTITTIYGKSRAYKILDFQPDRMMLRKAETGEDEPAWDRIADDAAKR